MATHASHCVINHAPEGEYVSERDCDCGARIKELEAALRDCTDVMAKNIYPKPDAETGTPWVVLQHARQLLDDK